MKVFSSRHRRPAGRRGSSGHPQPLHRAPDGATVRRILQPPSPVPAGARSEPASVLAAPLSRAGGEALPTGVRSYLEPRLNADLGSVRVHRDPPAAAASAALDARAFTVGGDIWLGAGESIDDRRLMAHELVHTLQQRPGQPPVIRRTPRVANQAWTVDHSDVAGLDEIVQIGVAVDYLGVSSTVAQLYGYIAARRSQWSAKKGLYVRALDFLRDNRDRFDVPDAFDLIRRALTYCDGSSATATALTDAFYEGLLTFAVYSAAPGAATFTHHTFGDVFDIPGRRAGSADFAPSGDDALLRPNPTPLTEVTGGFSGNTDLLVAYGAQSGSVATASVSTMLGAHSGRIPSRLRAPIETLATDPTLFSVLQRFLADDNGRFLLQRVGYGGAHYTRARPPSIEVDPDLFPGSGADREATDIGLRATLAHELYHYALDRADAALTEVGRESDHRLISVVQDRYTIVERLRAGQSPVSSEVECLRGYVGGDPKPALRNLIGADDRAGLRSFVRNQDFLDSTVFTMLVSALGDNQNRIGGTFGHNVAEFLLDPSQVTDLLYLAAINGVILRKAFELAADVSERTRTPLARVWRHADYRAEMRTFIARYIGMASQNRREGAAALAAMI